MLDIFNLRGGVTCWALKERPSLDTASCGFNKLLVLSSFSDWRLKIAIEVPGQDCSKIGYSFPNLVRKY